MEIEGQVASLKRLRREHFHLDELFGLEAHSTKHVDTVNDDQAEAPQQFLPDLLSFNFLFMNDQIVLLLDFAEAFARLCVDLLAQLKNTVWILVLQCLFFGLQFDAFSTLAAQPVTEELLIRFLLVIRIVRPLVFNRLMTVSHLEVFTMLLLDTLLEEAQTHQVERLVVLGQLFHIGYLFEFDGSACADTAYILAFQQFLMIRHLAHCVKVLRQRHHCPLEFWTHVVEVGHVVVLIVIIIHLLHDICLELVVVDVGVALPDPFILLYDLRFDAHSFNWSSVTSKSMQHV